MERRSFVPTRSVEPIEGDALVKAFVVGG